ncbi:MAG: type II toxin-antitoxin system mRNA interferase toxin, RelE/StbE family [bacterium]|nr:type II toxin-antitoxin system mRNA interferase toxin, RelE/StbE family [bacterium]
MERVMLVYTRTFLRDAARLPHDIRARLLVQVEHLRNNPADARLHHKKLHGRLEGLESFRITRNYRVLYRHQQQMTYLLLAVDDRKDIYR